MNAVEAMNAVATDAQAQNPSSDGSLNSFREVDPSEVDRALGAESEDESALAVFLDFGHDGWNVSI